MFDQPTGPTLLGFDVVMVGTVLAGLAAFAMVLAIYAAVTIRDPMAKRVKVLEARREQLKAGIVTSSAKKRTRLARRSDATDKVKDSLGKLNVLQDSQIKVIQQKLAHAGYRNKELAVLIIGARAILPIIVGALAALLIYVVEYWPDWGPMTRLFAFAGSVFVAYKGPELFLSNKASKRTKEIQKGLPDALDLLVICAEAGLSVDAAFNRVAKELGRAYPQRGDEFALTAIELSFLKRPQDGESFNNLAYRVNLEAGLKGNVRHHHDPDNVRHAGFARSAPGRKPPKKSSWRIVASCELCSALRNARIDARRGKARACRVVCDDRPDPFIPADAVRRFLSGCVTPLAIQKIITHNSGTGADRAHGYKIFFISTPSRFQPAARAQGSQQPPRPAPPRGARPASDSRSVASAQRPHFGMDPPPLAGQFEQGASARPPDWAPAGQQAGFFQHPGRAIEATLSISVAAVSARWVIARHTRPPREARAHAMIRHSEKP